MIGSRAAAHPGGLTMMRPPAGRQLQFAGCAIAESIARFEAVA
jgi:hypothetical protein